MPSKTARDWSATLEDLVLGKRAPRALVVETIKHMKRALAWQHARWGIGLTVYDPETRWRKRRPNELPENDPREWARLVETAAALEVTASELKAFALTQQRKAESRALAA